MKHLKIIIMLLVVLATVFSVTSFAFAALDEDGNYIRVDGSELIYDSRSISAWNTWYKNNKTGWLQSWVEKFGGSILWNYFDAILAKTGTGSCFSQDILITFQNSWPFYSDDWLASLFLGASTNLDGWLIRPEIAFDSSLSVYRLRDIQTGLWIVNSSGHFPYYRPPVDEDGNVPAVDTTGVQWLPYKDAFEKQTNRHFVTKDVLDDMADYYNGVVIVSGKYYVITTTDPITGSYLYLCDPHGYPYVNVVDPDSTAVNTPNDYYTDDSQTTTQNGLLIDLIQNVTWFPDGTMQYIDSVIYDESKQAYYVDSHDTYNYINDSYNTTNYHWEYNYYIDYTSITYIGQTEEYEDPYQCYYELPDGRSSADLTKEELEQLALCFVDVINYARSADDTNMRVLYHFDGNLEDSSYWSYCTEFEWVKGASLTYMDEGTFNGSLYLDETAHEFIIHLPSLDMAGDFTFQFRYYQSYTAAPKSDSYISFGATQVMSLPGDGFYSSTGSLIAPTPVGSWNEVCFVRADGVLNYFINGVLYEQVTMSGSLGDYIRFVFGSEQQTYKKLDEMRFTKAPMYVVDGAYTPTAVPYDTNLALVLPDGEVPVADEYFTIVSPPGNLLARYDFTDTSTVSIKNFTPDSSWVVSASVLSSMLEDFFEPLGLYTFGGTAAISQGVEGSILSVKNPAVPMTDFSVSNSSQTATYTFNDLPQNCIGICLSTDGDMFVQSSGSVRFRPNISQPSSDSDAASYCLTVIDTDGNVSFIDFKYHVGTVCYFTYTNYQSTTFSFGIDGMFRNPELSLPEVEPYLTTQISGLSYGGYSYYPMFLCIYPKSDTTEIAYMELVRNTEPQYDIEWHTAVYSSGQLEDAPVLAVKATTEVTSWQIGGVRPSYPEKGMVWALVENGRITSLQLYTGYAWIAVDGRVWTGQRWIPPASFDVFTLQDFWDMVGTSGDDYTYIYTESGFWDWWQKQWYQFTGTLYDKLDKPSSGTDISINIENDVLLDEDDKDRFNENEYKGIVKTMRNIYDFVSDFFSDFTMGGIQDFLDVLNDKNSFIYGLFKLNGLG